MLQLQLGRTFMHQSIEFPGAFQIYLEQMSSRSRKSVQYSQRRLKRDFDVTLFVCTEDKHIERFLDHAIQVSKQTYQWNLLGLGLRDRKGFEHTLRKWLRFDSLRCYILYCDDVPTAFMLGYIYNGCYYYIDVGYDPAWSNHSVGSVLQMEVIEELYNLPTPPRLFDFSTGYGEHKARFGNTEQEEMNLLLLSDVFQNRLLRALYLSLDKFSSFIVIVLERVGVKKQLKKLIRRFA